jgi:hypothetical protein
MKTRSNSMFLLPVLLLLAAPAFAASKTAPAPVNDFPTVDRVLYVQECMNGRQGPYYEMVNKCSCALDALAREIRHADYVQISTAAKATSIGGERGSYIRDTEQLQTQIKRYRELQTRVKAGCFLEAEPK